MVDNKQYNRGSEWRKWDLHLHTPASYDYKNKLVTNEEIIKKLKENDISVVAITDHHIMDVEKIKNLQTLGEKENITILPGIEFCSESRGKEPIHFIGIFSEISDISYIWNEVNTKTNIATQKKSGKKDNEIHCKLEETCVLIKKLGGIVSIHAGNKSNTLENITNSLPVNMAEKKDIVKNIDIFELGKVSDQNDYKEKVFPILKQTIPMIICSDNHKISNYSLKENCWIKADLTFEGLKQALYEPKERVFIQERNPSDSKTKRLIIDRVIYKTSNEEEKVVYFNGDMNSIIGVRGSGKSTLLKNLAQKIDPNEFSKRDKKVPYTLSDFEVVWRDGQKDGGTEESPKSIFYIPQGYLSALAYDDGERASERDSFLTQLLKKNELFANAIQSFENFVSKNKVHIEGLIQKLLTASVSIKENIALLKKQGAKAEIEEEIKKKNEQIKKYKGTDITDKEIQNYSEAQKIVDDSKKEVGILKQDKDILADIKKTGARVFISDQEFSLLSSTRQGLIQKELQKKNKESLKTLIDEEIVKIDAQIAKFNKIITNKEKIVKELEVKVKKTKALEDLTKELAALKKTIDTIKKLTDKLEKAKRERSETTDALADAYGSFESQQTSIYKTIKFEEKFSFLKVEVVARYNTQQLKTFVERNINTRDSDQSIKSKKEIKELFGDTPKQISADTIKKLIIGLIDEKVIIKVEAGDIGTVLAQLLKNRFEIDYLNSVKTINGRTHFKDMTGGQKAIALLELIFGFDDEKYPILIDQPEDDLDVGGIASDLVNFVTSEKQDRQIITVTHNASLVICADTENIIVSDIKSIGRSKYDFSYATGSIENLDRRSDIIEILEGGESALKKRMLKLNVH